MLFRRGPRGLSLMEVVVAFTLVLLLLGVTLYSLRPGEPKTASIGLATALADQFRSARQSAIAQGYPVAIGLPTDGSTVSDSIYRLEGWNVPLVTSSTGYSGEYPKLGFAAAGWSGATFINNPSPPPLSKFGAFALATWIPTAHQGDSIFCFTPDGGVVANGMPSLDGRYTVVVASNPEVEAHTITAGTEPCVVYISTGGAVDISKQLPGSALVPGTVYEPRASTKDRERLTGGARVTLSKIEVRPSNSSPSVDAFCTPGQQVTFEFYAYDIEGRELFAQWTQTGPGGKLGNFAFPKSRDGDLTSEVERMEYLESPPTNIDWNSGDPPPGGCFRARWTWTVPQNSTAGDIYEVTADVQDATGTATIENPPPPLSFKAAPEGRLLAEIWNAALGRWELVRMNPNGSGREVLTAPGLEETMPSIDRSATKLALLQGPIGDVNNRCVKVRSLTGGGEFKIAGPGRYTSVSLSPDGGWISYRLDDAGVAGNGKLYVHRLDQGSPVPIVQQNWHPIPIPAVDEEPSRTGWSLDGLHVLWGNGGDPSSDYGKSGIIQIGDLTNSGGVTNIRTLYTNTLEEGQLYAPTVFDPGSGPRLMFTISNINPVLAHIPFTPNTESHGNTQNEDPCVVQSHKIDLDGWGGDTGSGNFDDNLANISQDGRKVVLPRIDRPNSNKRYALIARWNDGVNNFVAEPMESNTIREQVRSLVWIP